MFDNIILISIDTLRSDCINLNPINLWQEKYDLDYNINTPTLDALAHDGAFFPNCITSAPYTSSSHASVITGKWPVHHGMYEFFNRKLNSNTIFKFAKQRGYHTTLKTDFTVILGKFLGFTRNVDNYIAEDDQSFLDAFDSLNPSLSLAHFGGVHMPYGFHNLKYGGQDYINKVHEMEAEIIESPGKLADQLTNSFRGKDDLELLYRYKQVIQYHYKNGNYQKIFNWYLEGINYFMKNRFDPFMNKLLDKLKGRRFLLIIFGDHGEEYDEHSYGHYNSLSEGVIRIPVIFYGTDVKPNIWFERIRSIDIAPTILHLMGANSKSYLNMDGISLANTICDGNNYPTLPAFSQTYVADTQKFVEFQRRIFKTGRKTGHLPHFLYKEAVYDKDYKLIRQLYELTQDGGIWGLNKIPPKVFFEKINNLNKLQPYSDTILKNKLLKMLDTYNLKRKSTTKKIHIPENIEAQLQNMGYKI